MAKIEIYVCDNCGTKLGELACGNSKGGSYCSVECAEQAELSTVADSQFLDLIANLARRVASLEQQLSATQGNVEKLAEELANVKYLTESNEQDIAMLDERTQPTEELVTPDESIPQYWAEALIRFYGGSR
jgi:TolA-binding protein